jgi:hypothetical protein
MREEYDFSNATRTSRYAELYAAKKAVVAGETKAILIGSLSELASATARREQHLTLFLAMDATDLGNDQIRKALSPLIERDLKYFCAWGPGCERVHDIADSIRDEDRSGAQENELLMTTWHQDETLDEALDFFTLCAVPVNSAVYKGFDRVAVSVANTVWYNEMTEALSKFSCGSKA